MLFSTSNTTRKYHKTFANILGLSGIFTCLDVTAIITDSTVYCIKPYKDVLWGLWPKPLHVTCLAHFVSLAEDVFQHWPAFDDLATLMKILKSVSSRIQAILIFI